MIIKKLENIINVLKDGLLSIYLYQTAYKKIPVFVVKEVNFVFLNSIRDFFVKEHFIILTESDISDGKDVFCLKLLHIKNHSELFYGKDVLGTFSFNLSDLRSTLELEIRNKSIQLREGYLSQDKGKDFLHDLLTGMQIIWEGALWLKHSTIKLPDDMKTMISLFDVAWSCNSQNFYYLIDDMMEERKVPLFIQEVHHYLSELCVKINNY